jgi:hypothetical protein
VTKKRLLLFGFGEAVDDRPGPGKASLVGLVSLAFLLVLVLISTGTEAQGSTGYALRVYGHGDTAPDQDRVKIMIDDPTNANPGPPADVGATDFTLEFWMKGSAAENTAGAVSCGSNVNWIYGNIVFDRDRFNQDRKFGLSIAGGTFVFGVTGDGTGDRTICGTTDVLDNQWHHVAVQRRRSDGWMWLFVDGNLEAAQDGPDGDISYPDDGVPGDFCGGPCVNSDPYLVIGAEKHDAGSAYPSYSGLIDEVRLSNSLRYTSAFTPPSGPFTPDAGTVALYYLDEGPAGACTGSVLDSSGASGGPSHGECKYGGSAPAGPVYSTETPFAGGDTTPPTISNVTASPLATSTMISWTTNENATSQVIYGISPDLNQSTTETTNYVTMHSVTLSSLSPGTTYVYRVRSRDAAGNLSTSEQFGFTTFSLEGVRWVYLPVILRGR